MRHRAFLPGLCALLVALFLTAPRDARRELPPPFQGIARADRSVVSRLREVWTRHGDDDRNARKGAELRRRATALGEPASRALLEILAKHYADADMDWSSTADVDDRWEPEGGLIGELASDATARTLALAVADKDLSRGLRRSLVVALCRARFAWCATTLAGIACDRGDDPEIREAILCRFHRLGAPPPASMKDLLYQPYHGFDVLAAAMLAICGDVEAPSLIHEGLTAFWTNDDEAVLALCAEAVHRITRKPLEFSHSYTVTGFPTTEAASRARVAPHVRALEAWMDEHPSNTRYERLRLTYLQGPRRKRELSVRTVADVLAAGDEFDLAAASLWLTTRLPDAVPGHLERLERLAHLCGTRLADAKDRAARIEVLNDLLAQLPPREYHDARDGSWLSGVLRRDYGNCLGRSTLYLTVADRLGLPLRAYALPDHVYVAWEEEGIRRNIETTDRGRERPADGIAATRRGMLSIHLSNLAAALMDAECYADALRSAEQAVALDAGNASALFARALAAWQTDLDVDPRPDLDRAAEIFPLEPSYWLVSSEVAWKLGFPDDALRRAEIAFRMAPSPDAVAMQVRTLLDLGERQRALTIADRAAARWPNARGALAFARFEIDLDREGYAPLDRTDISPLWKARALLKRASPARALAWLDQAREDILAERRTSFDGRVLNIVEPDTRGQREFHLLEAQALAKLGRIDEARAAFGAAEKAAPPDRETLEVRKLLAGE